MPKKLSEDVEICVIGLGYVGLPLAIEFSKYFKIIGFDINSSRIQELKLGKDSTLEVDKNLLHKNERLTFTNKVEEIEKADIYIVTVPTPIDENKNPDLSPLKEATKLVGKYLNEGNFVIFESTVYPGATEEVCIPILEKISKLQLNKDFFIGYSPERINPGDKDHRISDIVKVTSGSNNFAAEKVDELYKKVILAGTFRASSIKVAEAAKVIENTQRDINIALINELAIIFANLEIDTREVLDAAETKWNFMPFRPGLVGGHCISVDPYYLTHKAQQLGYNPEVILAGRRINDNMGLYISNQVRELMSQKKIKISNSRILILGLAFKENCPDIRNTKVIDIVNELRKYHINVDIYDPWVDNKSAKNEYGLELELELENNVYDAIIVAVAHDIFKDLGAEKIRELGKAKCVIYDAKGIISKKLVDARL